MWLDICQLGRLGGLAGIDTDIFGVVQALVFVRYSDADWRCLIWRPIDVIVEG